MYQKLALVCLTVLVAASQSLIAANIAIIDSGVDYKHKDLAPVMWTNPNSSTTDEDGTVYQNDTHGWNFAEKNNEVIDYKYLGTFSDDCYKLFDVQGKILMGVATDDDKAWYKSKIKDQKFLKEVGTFGNFVHGTHVSGISSKNAPEAKLIAMKLIPTETPSQSEKHFRETNARGADNMMAKLMLNYAAKQQAAMLTTVGKYTKAVKADVANGSFGTSVPAVKPVVAGILKNLLGHEPTDQESTDYTIYFINQIIDASKAFPAASPSTLFVFAAGNDGTNNDQLPTSPANIKLGNTIAVAATMGTTSLASFSNYGENNVDVAAPGVVIRSTIPGDQYLAMSGTSMAAPYVTNVAGLVKDANHALGSDEIKKVLMETVDVKDFLRGKVKSSGIVNDARAVRAAVLSKDLGLTAAIAQAKVEVRDIVDNTPWSRGDASDIFVLPLPNPFH